MANLTESNVTIRKHQLITVHSTSGLYRDVSHINIVIADATLTNLTQLIT